MIDQPPRKLAPGLRWLGIGLRTAHICAVALIGIDLHGGHPPFVGTATALVTGLALYALEWRRHPAFWRELAGVVAAAKLVLLAAIAQVPALAAGLFWTALVASSVISHAPRTVRHRRLFG